MGNRELGKLFRPTDRLTKKEAGLSIVVGAPASCLYKSRNPPEHLLSNLVVHTYVRTYVHRIVESPLRSAPPMYDERNTNGKNSACRPGVLSSERKNPESLLPATGSFCSKIPQLVWRDKSSRPLKLSANISRSVPTSLTLKQTIASHLPRTRYSQQRQSICSERSVPDFTGTIPPCFSWIFG